MQWAQLSGCVKFAKSTLAGFGYVVIKRRNAGKRKRADSSCDCDKKQSAKMILQMLQKEPIAIGCYDETHIYSLEEEDRPSFQKHYLQSFTDTTPVMSCFKTITETDLPKTILKIELLEKDEEKRQRLQTRLSTLQEVKVTTSGWDNLEITSPLVSKGTALQTYVAQHGFTKEEVLVFGDSENDLSMFSCFPNSVAVANACTQIKKCCSLSL